MIARRPASIALALVAVAVAAILSGCSGAQATSSNEIRGERLTVYVSVPLHGASAISGEAVLQGAQLALDAIRGRIGAYRVGIRVLDNANVHTGTWDPGLTTTNVHAAMLDPTMIGYVGDYNSGASAISIPLLNRAEIPQISPTSTAVGLTDGGPEAAPGEPDKYYPTGRRTFARVVPTDAIQANVLAQLQTSSGCTKTYILDDGEVDGRDIADSFDVAARQAKLDVVGMQQYEPKATSYTSLASGVASSNADCVLIAALTENHAALITRQIAAALPDALIFGSSGLAESTYVNPSLGGIPLSLDARVLITDPALAPGSDPASARRFFAAYKRRFGDPQPSAILGYEAMSLMLNAISRATDRGKAPAVRSKVVSAIFATRDRHSVLGTYSINAGGDTTLDSYGVYRIVDGQLRFLKAIRG